jgi:hypothetical protein
MIFRALGSFYFDGILKITKDKNIPFGYSIDNHNTHCLLVGLGYSGTILFSLAEGSKLMAVCLTIAILTTAHFLQSNNIYNFGGWQKAEPQDILLDDTEEEFDDISDE